MFSSVMTSKNLSLALFAFAIISMLVPFQAQIFTLDIPNAAAASVTITRPNIVVIMVDDLEKRSLDIMIQNGLVPNLKRHIIDKSVEFSSSFVTYPLCCPSRSTFLTGQYPHNHDVWSNALPNGGASKLADSSTIATWLQDAQYHTGYVGKYLNG